MADGLTVIATPALRGLLRLPPNPARGLPLLCFLHGFDEAAPLNIHAALRRHGPLQPQAPQAMLDRFIVAVPQLPIAGDHWRRHADEVHELVAELRRAHGADPSRCYVSGFSFGGNGAFDLAAQRPDVWAAVWAVDPTRLPSRELRAPAWLSIGEVSRRQAYAFIDRLQSKPPDAALLGDRIHLDEHEDHVGSARRAFADERIYEWLLKRSLVPSAASG
ncbi:MAG: hypothetical protein ACLGI7_08455 [Gammaproteobacteria bacterium]